MKCETAIALSSRREKADTAQQPLHTASFTEHLRKEIDHDGAEDSAAEKEIEQRVTDRGDRQKEKSGVDHIGDRLGLCAPSPHEKDDKADQQNQAKPSATDGGPAKVEAATAE